MSDPIIQGLKKPNYCECDEDEAIFGHFQEAGLDVDTVRLARDYGVCWGVIFGYLAAYGRDALPLLKQMLLALEMETPDKEKIKFEREKAKKEKGSPEKASPPEHKLHKESHHKK